VRGEGVRSMIVRDIRVRHTHSHTHITVYRSTVESHVTLSLSLSLKHTLISETMSHMKDVYERYI